MTEFAEKPLDLGVATATILPAKSEDALQIFDRKELPIEDDMPIPPPAPVQAQEPSNGPENPAVFEKEKGRKIVLGTIDDADKVSPSKTVKVTPKRNTSPNKARNSSPRRSVSPRVRDSPNNNESPSKIREPSASLMKTTAARVRDVQVLEDRKQKKDPNSSPQKKREGEDRNYQPSERLLRPTQSRIMDVREWEAHKERQKYEDDIWWEMRKPAETAKVNPNTPSKLHEPTASFAKQVRPKYEAPKEETKTPVKEVHRLPAKIDQDSPLLKKTTAAKVQSWKSEVTPPEPPKPHLNLESKTTGPQNVQSKLSYDTASSKLNKWKTKEQQQAEQQKPASPGPNQTKKVAHVSPRLLELNESLKMSVKSKVVKNNSDPRESGWAPIHGKVHIPTIEEMHDHLVRQYHHEQSTISSHPNSSGSAMNSGDIDDHHEHHQVVYPDEQHHGEEQQHHEEEQEQQHHEEEESRPEDDEHLQLSENLQTLDVN